MTLKEFWDSKEKLAINCRTEEQAKKFCEGSNKLGKSYLTSDNMWNHHKENTCYSNKGEYCYKGFYEEINCKVLSFEDIEWEENKMKKVKVINIGERYTTYKEFVRIYANKLTKNFKDYESPKLNKIYDLILMKPHTTNPEDEIALIQDSKTKQVYVIGKEGLEFLDDEKHTCPVCDVLAEIDDILKPKYQFRVVESRRSVSLYKDDTLLKRVHCHEDDTFDWKIGLGIALQRTIYKDDKDVLYLSKILKYKNVALFCLNKFCGYDLSKLEQRVANRKREDKLVKF